MHRTDGAVRRRQNPSITVILYTVNHYGKDRQFAVSFFAPWGTRKARASSSCDCTDASNAGIRLTDLLQRRAGSADAGLAHVAAMAVGVVAAAGVEQAAVVPEDDVARPPGMIVDVFRLDRFVGQLVDQGAA